MTVYTVLGTDDENLRVTVTDGSVVTIDVNPATLQFSSELGVSSVNGQSGNVILDTDDIAEGDTNLYHTEARVQAIIDGNDLASETYVDTAKADAISAANAYTLNQIGMLDIPASTTDLAEGANLYYTDARVQTVIDTNTADFATESYVDTSIANLVDTAPATLDTLNELAAALGDDPNFATTISNQLGLKFNTADFDTTADTWLTGKTTTDLTEGDNLYYTQARFDTAFGNKTTTDLTEGTNLYYTDARVDSYLRSGDVDVINFTDGAVTLDWNTDDGTLNLNYANDVSLQLGQETHFYAKATEAISNGDIVMFAGAQGNHLLIALADQSAPGFQPEYVIGVATQDFNNNEFGYVTSFGKVRDLDTSAYTEGDIIWLDPATPGGWTTTRPTPAQGHSIQVAAVTYSQINNGTIFVRPIHIPDTDETPEGSTNLYYTSARVDAHLNTGTATTDQVLSWTGIDYAWVDAGAGGASALDDLTDVEINTGLLGDGDILRYNGTSETWQNTNIGITLAPTLTNYNDREKVYAGHMMVFEITGSYDQPSYEVIRVNPDTSETILSVITAKPTVGVNLMRAAMTDVALIENGVVNILMPDTAGTYTLKVRVQDFGDLPSEYTELEVVVEDVEFNPSDVSGRHYRLTTLHEAANSSNQIYLDKEKLVSNVYPQINEMRFHTSAAGGGTAYPDVDMTSNTAPSPYVASASTVFINSATYQPWKSFDSSTSTFWWGYTSAGSDWIQIDMGQTLTIKSLVIQMRQLNSVAYGFKIEVSDTGDFTGEETEIFHIDGFVTPTNSFIGVLG